MERKEICRKHHLELRNQMHSDEVLKKSQMICETISGEPWFLEADTIYGYYPLGNEVNCLPLLQLAMQQGKRVALPRTGKACRMDFYEVRSLDQVEEGTFHVMEPLASCPLIEVREAAVLVPGVVFDREGNRYGYGKGYYDRYFSRFMELKRYAVAYENQIEEKIATALTDVKMHQVYTEREKVTPWN